MNKEAEKMYEYLYQHAYISDKKKSNYQFEMTDERAECIAAKHSSLTEELQQENEQLRERISYLERSITRKEETIDELNFERVPYENEYVKKLEKENKQLTEQLEYLRSGEYYSQLKFERDMLQNVIDTGEVSKEDKEFIDMTHRNTELLDQLKQRDEVIDELKNIFEKASIELDKVLGDEE